MNYYDKWNDLNRRAHSRGERDADRGYMSCHHYDRFSECGAAYEDGYYEKRRKNERREEERQEEERAEERRETQRRFEYQQKAAEQQELEYEQELEEERCEILFRKFEIWGPPRSNNNPDSRNTIRHNNLYR